MQNIKLDMLVDSNNSITLSHGDNFHLIYTNLVNGGNNRSSKAIDYIFDTTTSQSVDASVASGSDKVSEVKATIKNTTSFKLNTYLLGKGDVLFLNHEKMWEYEISSRYITDSDGNKSSLVNLVSGDCWYPEEDFVEDTSYNLYKGYNSGDTFEFYRISFPVLAQTYNVNFENGAVSTESKKVYEWYHKNPILGLDPNDVYHNAAEVIYTPYAENRTPMLSEYCAPFIEHTGMIPGVIAEWPTKNAPKGAVLLSKISTIPNGYIWRAYANVNVQSNLPMGNSSLLFSHPGVPRVETEAGGRFGNTLSKYNSTSGSDYTYKIFNTNFVMFL